MSLKRKGKILNIEVGPITVPLPPPVPAQVQTVEPQRVGQGDTFKNFYHSNIKTFAAPQQKLSFVEKAADYIKRNEGVRDMLYKDSKGYWTIGIGHLVTPQEYKLFKGRRLNEQEILNIFEKDLNKKIQIAKIYFGPKFDEFSDQLKIAIIDGYFRGDLAGSPLTKSLLKKGDFKSAAKEYLNNKEYKAALASGSGVARRMQRNAAIMAAET